MGSQKAQARGRGDLEHRICQIDTQELPPRLKTALAVLLPLLCVAVLFSRVLPTLDTRFAGIEYVDHYGTQWFYWFAEQTLLGERSVVHTDLMFFPFGKDIYGHTGANILDAYVALPFRLLFGHVAGYNLFLLMGVLASGAAAARFAWHLTRDAQASSLAFIVLAISPWALYEATEGRPTQALLALPILFIHAAWVSGTEKGWRAPVLAGMYLALTGYQYWFYAFFVGMGAVILGLWATWRRTPGAGPWWQILTRFALAAGIAGVLCGPAVMPMLLATSGAETEIPGLLHVEIWNLTASPPLTDEGQIIGVFNWQPLRRAAGFYVTNLKSEERFLTRITLTPWLALPMLALWLREPGRLERIPVMIWLGLATLLAMGPLVLVGSYLLPNPPYIWLAKHVGFFQRLWWPGRAYVLIALMMPSIAAGALMSFPARWRTLAWLGMSLGWTAETAKQGLLPFESWDASVPAGYKCLAQGTPGALLELPYNFTQAHLYYQVVHGRPIFGGMLENNKVFTPQGTTNLLRGNNALIGLQDPTSFYDEDFEVGVTDLQVFYDLGFRYVILQKDAFRGPEAAGTDPKAAAAIRSRARNSERSLRTILGTPNYSDARVSIYSLGDTPPACDQKAWDKDLKLMGITEVDPIPRDIADSESQIVNRLFEPELPLKLRRLSIQLGIAAGLSTGQMDTGDTGSLDQ